MKALSYKQPWAYLVASGIKNIENRTWPCPKEMIGKRHLIHASGQCVGIKELDSLLNEETRKLFEENNFDRKSIKALRRSAIIGSVVIEECIIDSQSIWAIPGDYHWVLSEPVLFDKPIECKGTLGFWEYEFSESDYECTNDNPARHDSCGEKEGCRQDCSNCDFNQCKYQ